MMLSRPIILAAALLLFPALGLADGEARFMTYPDISGDRIVFTFDDDLWVASAQGGTPAGDDLVFAGNSKVYVTSFEKAYQSRKLGKPADTTGMVYRVSPVEEWTQILNDTWRWYRDFFYDKGLHGRDWKAIGDRYRACVKDLRSRDQPNWLLSEMVGELCVSHTYISGGDTGPDIRIQQPVFTGLLGADLAADPKTGLYRLARIYGPTPYFSGIEMPLARPDIGAREGDYLIAINGKKVQAPDNYFRLLQVAKDDYVDVTLSSDPAGENARTWRVKPVRSDQEARYARWVTGNIEQVLKASNGEVGYMHITAMGGGGIMQFDDGEAFVEHFKARKLGTVVGVPSWGGLVGIINGQRTIDNGTVQQSNNAFYGSDGKWLVENHGADPDVLQDNDPGSVAAGHDLQLEKSVEILLKKIKDEPFSFPRFPNIRRGNMECGASAPPRKRRRALHSIRLAPPRARGVQLSQRLPCRVADYVPSKEVAL